MKAFDHLADGTPEQAWQTRGLADLPTLPPLTPTASLLVLAAHPDDETLGAGALIQAALAHGAEVRVVIATDGEASHPRSPTHTPYQLVALRRAEARRALQRLHPDLEPVFLGLPDGALADLTSTLETMLGEHVAGRTHVVCPWLGDGHPDHRACARVARRLRSPGVHLWQYPIWAWHWDDPAEPALPWAQLRRSEPTAAALAAKRDALAQYRSQVSPLSPAAGDEAVVTPQMSAHFERDHEYFVIDAPAGDPRFFADLFVGDDDPWGLEQRFYELRKRALLLAALPAERFTRAFEPGCCGGALTAELARRCDQVVAWDAAPLAVERASRRFADSQSVEVAHGAVPTTWPEGQFDLVVLSEIGYYCPDLGLLVDRVVDSMTADGCVVAAHWRRDAPDHPHTAQAVHAAFDARLPSIVHHVEDDFLLDVWTVDGRSVAERTGVI